MSGLSVHRVGDSHVRQLRDDDGYIATFGATDADLLDLARQLAPGMVLLDRATIKAAEFFLRSLVEIMHIVPSKTQGAGVAVIADALSTALGDDDA